MIETYKILTGIYDRKVTTGFVHLHKNTEGTRRTLENSLKLYKERSRLENTRSHKE